MNQSIESVIVENKKLKDAISHMKELLINREHLASIGERIPGITHEINTPLGVAVSAGSFLEVQNKRILDLFEEGHLTKKELSEYLDNACESTEIINQNLNRAVTLIKAIKDVSAYHNSGIQVSFDLGEHIHRIISTLKHEYKQSNHVIVVQCEPMTLYGSPGVFSQILTNLIMNSLIHGFEDRTGGRIVIKVILEDELKIIYTDDGKGIDEDVIPYIFEPYYTTKRQAGGTGLGLSIIKELVCKRLKGELSCKSKINKGVTFTIHVPLKEIEKR